MYLPIVHVLKSSYVAFTDQINNKLTELNLTDKQCFLFYMLLVKTKKKY